MKQWLKEVARGKRGSKDLSYDETREAAASILSGEATDAQTAGYFIAQRMKTESADEMLALVHELQQSSMPIDIKESVRSTMLDVAGPYNGRKSFLATIPVSLLLAERGIPVHMHSSDSLPPKYGTTIKEVVAALGIPVDQTDQQIASSIEQLQVGFSWTERFCPPLHRLRELREQLHVRTMLNTAEKLLNLGNASSLMMGAYHRTAINKITPLFSGLSYDKVYIVQGVEGSEDLPVHRNSFVFKLTEDKVEDWVVKPKDYGLLCEAFDKDRKLSVEEQCDIIEALLQGHQEEPYTYYYNQVLWNAGLRYYLFNHAESMEEGIAIAKEQLAEKRGYEQLKKWIRHSGTDEI
ncbi:anthranilate phosphoribosyltransferase [Pontibacillus salicampi]|uniref:Anthranilate phosphoribosyltransferase n=1 Tax=Pontibacillus salicampi TaxID=1449801 RepID=A0ABV6LNG3_9BACI